MATDTQAQTLRDVLDGGAADRPALVAPDGPTITYSGLREQVDRLSAQLRDLGVRKDDRVAIVLPNGLESIVTFLAVTATCTAAPLNAAYKTDEFAFYLEDTNASAVITGPEGGEAIVAVAPAGAVHITAAMDDDGQVALTAAGAPRGAAGASRPSAGDVALVLHTSGTTSRPKRVPLTHRNLTTSLRNIAATYTLTEDDISFCVMPLFHVHGLVASTLATLHTGGTVVAPPRFNPLNFWPVAREHRITWFSAVPTMHQALLARARSAHPEVPESLRFIRSCSAALPPVVMDELEQQFGVPVVEAYGMTEAAHQMASNPLPPGDRLPGAVGPGTGVEIAIMDEEGTLLEAGERGEVVIRGANVIAGYENNPDANASSFTNGWFRTGDEGVLDGQGYLTLTGRLKEMINRSGEKISPLEIDNALLDHPAVAEAVAFGVPHQTHGEEASAAVVLSGEATPAELVAHCRERLADFKCPRAIHIMQEIPRGPTGKIQRRFLTEMFSK